jgi:hypothetical protein
VNPIRRVQLGHRYPHVLPALLDLLSMYPEEAADPVTLEQLAALEPGRSVAELLRARYPATIPGPPAERARAPLFWRRPAPAVEREDPDLPF